MGARMIEFKHQSDPRINNTDDVTDILSLHHHVMTVPVTVTRFAIVDVANPGRRLQRKLFGGWKLPRLHIKILGSTKLSTDIVSAFAKRVHTIELFGCYWQPEPRCATCKSGYHNPHTRLWRKVTAAVASPLPKIE